MFKLGINIKYYPIYGYYFILIFDLLGMLFSSMFMYFDKFIFGYDCDIIWVSGFLGNR